MPLREIDLSDHPDGASRATLEAEKGTRFVQLLDNVPGGLTIHVDEGEIILYERGDYYEICDDDLTPDAQLLYSHDGGSSTVRLYLSDGRSRLGFKAGSVEVPDPRTIYFRGIGEPHSKINADVMVSGADQNSAAFQGEIPHRSNAGGVGEQNWASTSYRSPNLGLTGIACRPHHSGGNGWANLGAGPILGNLPENLLLEYPALLSDDREQSIRLRDTVAWMGTSNHATKRCDFLYGFFGGKVSARVVQSPAVGFLYSKTNGREIWAVVLDYNTSIDGGTFATWPKEPLERYDTGHVAGDALEIRDLEIEIARVAGELQITWKIDGNVVASHVGPLSSGLITPPVNSTGMGPGIYCAHEDPTDVSEIVAGLRPGGIEVVVS